MIDISEITEQLFVASKMDTNHLEELTLLNVDLVISMIADVRPPPEFYEAPFQFVWLKTHDTFFTPISVRVLMKGVKAAVPLLQKKGRVLVFCIQGRRRSVTMAAAILIARGNTADEAIKMIKTSRFVADPSLWYVKARIRKFERYWNRNKHRHPDLLS